MSAIASLEGGAASSRSDAFLPAWSRDTTGIAVDSEAFARAVGVESGRVVGVESGRGVGVETNALGLRVTKEAGIGGRHAVRSKGAAGFQTTTDPLG